MTQREAILYLSKQLRCSMFDAMFHKDNSLEERKRAVVSYRSVKGNSVYCSMRKRLNDLIKMDMWKVVNVNDNDESHEIPANDYDDAKHWVINHLDSSKEWCVYNISEEIYE